MAQRQSYTQQIHDRVVEASANTYAESIEQGYKVSTNPGATKSQKVGGEPGLYPDVIVWMPDTNNPSSGKAIIIEEIETEDTVNENEASQWLKFGELGIKFQLIVPFSHASIALQLVQNQQINVSEIWYYTISPGNQILFEKYVNLK